MIDRLVGAYFSVFLRLHLSWADEVAEHAANLWPTGLKQEVDMNLLELRFYCSLEIRNTRFDIFWAREDYPHDTLNLEEVFSKYRDEKVYSTEGRVVAFMADGFLYVTPKHSEAIKTLDENGYRREDFKVPLADGSFPVWEVEHWCRLLSTKNPADYFSGPFQVPYSYEHIEEPDDA